MRKLPATLLLLGLGALLTIAGVAGAQSGEEARAAQEAVPEGARATATGAQENEGQEAEQAPPQGQQEEPPALPPVGDLPELSENLSSEQVQALRLVDEILREQRVLLSGESFVYQSDGRRDPFRSLLRLRQRELSAPISRPSGLPGFLINEVAVKAVAEYQGRWHAMIIGLDQRTYFAEVGTDLYDGRIVEINSNEIVFEQEVEDMLGARSTRKVVKRLRGEEG